MKFAVFSVAVVACVAVGCFVETEAGSSPQRNSAVLMGTVNLPGGSTARAFDRSTLDVDATANTPEIKGKIKNKTGQKMGDVRVTIRNKGAGTGSPPVGSSVTISNSNGSSTATFTAATSGGGWVADVAFDGGGGIGDLENDHEADVDIEVSDAGTAPPNDFDVKLTPSVPAKPKGTSYHADFMTAFDFRANRTQMKQSVDDNYHDRIATFVENHDHSRSMTALSGTLTLLPGRSLNSVYVQDPENSFSAVSGVVTNITGAKTFTMTGMGLAKGKKYELVLVFDAAPQGDTALSLTATFAE